MRLRHPDGQQIHLAYGTNVHPAEDLPGILSQLREYGAEVRRQVDTDVLGLGLWLAAPVAADLAADARARRLLRATLDEHGLEVVTLNGFPYAAFHAPVVKHAVYQPDWTDPARRLYTMDLALILSDLMPDDAVHGSISTLPLGWREPWDSSRTRLAGQALDRLAADLARLRRATGRHIRVAFEPEPGCVVETTPQAVDHLSTMDAEYLGVCLDLAHLACAWETPRVAIQRLADARIPVVKVQVSAALEVRDPVAAASVLRSYAEPRFLHQTRSTDGKHAHDDLAEALAANPPGPWRIHYHVPLHADPEPPLMSTTPVLREGLAALLAGPVAGCDHLEVETYTWSVLPPEARPEGVTGLAAGIAAEVRYARDVLTGFGLTDLGFTGPGFTGPGVNGPRQDKAGSSDTGTSASHHPTPLEPMER